MKRLAYFLYVTIILLISGLARANAMTVFDSTEAQYSSPVKVIAVSPDLNKLELKISLRLPNVCFGNPSALLVQDAADPEVLTIHLSSTPPLNANGCYESVNFVETTVSLPRLAQVAGLSLSAKALYKIKVEGYGFEITVPGANLL